jgi:ribonuclease HII
MKYPNLLEEKKLWKKRFKKVAGLDEAGRGCEKPDAEVLTNNGWRFYLDITLEDKVLSFTNDGFIKWQKIEKVIEKDFEGNLIELKNRGINIVVTPDHYFTVIRRVFKRDKKDNNRLKLVGYKAREERKKVIDLLSNDFIPRGGRWEGINKKFLKLPRIDKNGEKLIDIKLWIAFLGIFLAEGSTTCEKKKGSYKIIISQNEKSPYYKRIYFLLKKLPFKFSKIKNGFRCFNKQLYTYLKQFGNRYTKFIPKEIKELPLRLLNVLIDWMILGDGTCYTGKNRRKVCVYYTVSKRLKDDFEEVLLKAGWTYHTSVREPRNGCIGERIIKKENRVPCFEIRLRRNNKAQIKSLHRKEVFYKGKVFCLQLPKYHNFYVRRNGMGYFTGNSLAGPVVAAAVAINPKFQAPNFKQIRNSKFKIQKRFGNLDFSHWDLFGIWNLRFGILLKEVRDSKKLSPKKREKLYKLLKNCPFMEWGIGRVSERVIDKINIKNAAELAMGKALKNLEKKVTKKADFLIIDGNQLKNLKLKTYNLKLIVKGDEKVFSCACASILAKVTRDRLMRRYHKKYPKYRFDLHKGYPTKYHLKMLKKYGPCKIHRKTFGPVKKLLI